MKKPGLKRKQVQPAASPKRRTLESVMRKKFEVITLTEDVVMNDGDWLLHAGDVLFVRKDKNTVGLSKKFRESSEEPKKKKKGEDEGTDITDSLAIDDEEDFGEPLDLEDDGELEDDETEDGDDEEDPEGDEDSEDEDFEDDEDGLDDLDLEDEDEGDEDGDEDEAIDLLTTRKKEESRKTKVPGRKLNV